MAMAMTLQGVNHQDLDIPPEATEEQYSETVVAASQITHSVFLKMLQRGKRSRNAALRRGVASLLNQCNYIASGLQGKPHAMAAIRFAGRAAQNLMKSPTHETAHQVEAAEAPLQHAASWRPEHERILQVLEPACDVLQLITLHNHIEPLKKMTVVGARHDLEVWVEERRELELHMLPKAHAYATTLSEFAGWGAHVYGGDIADLLHRFAEPLIIPMRDGHQPAVVLELLLSTTLFMPLLYCVVSSAHNILLPYMVNASNVMWLHADIIAPRFNNSVRKVDARIGRTLDILAKAKEYKTIKGSSRWVKDKCTVAEYAFTREILRERLGQLAEALAPAAPALGLN